MTSILSFAAAAILAAGCGDSATGPGDTVQVVATTGVAADLVRAIGADRVSVSTLIPAGADPHAYEPRPRDLKALATAKLVVRSGGEIDEWLDDAIDSAGAGDVPEVTLLELATDGAAPPADAGTTAGHNAGVDPHWWHDPRGAIKAVDALRAALTTTAPDAAETFAAGAESETKALSALDSAIEACVHSVPAGDRKLVTSHDALGYYAHRYGFEVIGAVIPSRSTQARPAAGAVARLVATIKREGVKAIFAESSVNPKVERAIADEAGARIGGMLYADGLGAAGSPGATYLGALKANTETIVEALGGDVSTCRLP